MPFSEWNGGGSSGSCADEPAPTVSARTENNTQRIATSCQHLRSLTLPDLHSVLRHLAGRAAEGVHDLLRGFGHELQLAVDRNELPPLRDPRLGLLHAERVDAGRDLVPLAPGKDVRERLFE